MEGESTVAMYHRGKNFSVNEKFDQSGKIKSTLGLSSSNALLLSNPVLHEMDAFAPIYKWFSETLLIVSSETNFIYANDSDHLTSQIGKALQLLDTGAVDIKISPAKIEDTCLTADQIEELEKNLKSKEAVYFTSGNGDMFIAKSSGVGTSIKSIKIIKKDHMDNEFFVNLRQESNGTHRLAYLLPAILQLGKVAQGKVLVIDDFDKNLHVGMTRGLVEYHLNSLRVRSDSQLIFTTHDVALISNFILRNDEVWIIHKDYDGVSEMMRLIEFEGTEMDGMTFEQLYKTDNLLGTPRVDLISSHQLTARSESMRA